VRYVMLLAVLCLTLGTLQHPAFAAAPPAPANKIDHLILWGRNIDEVTSIMTAKLGFQVMPGRNPSGVANRFVRFADRGYIELLGITKANHCTVVPARASSACTLQPSIHPARFCRHAVSG
jgi:hypothetical protein